MTLPSKRLVAKFVGTAAELKEQIQEVLGVSRTIKIVCGCTGPLKAYEITGIGIPTGEIKFSLYAIN